MAIIDINNGVRSVECPDGSLLIDALREQGIYLPSGCGSKGQCGLCKVQLLDSVLPFSEQEKLLLTETERVRGVHLSCQVNLRGNLKVQLPKEYLASQGYTAKLSKKLMLTSDIVELTLELIEPQSIAFHPGQYILLKKPATEGLRELMRPFSIASSNSVTSSIQLNVRLNPEGVCTPWIFNELQVGQQVQFLGPKGNFFIQNTERPMLFIAGGSGMAPARSILRTMCDNKIARKAVFFFGALTQADLFYRDEMAQLERDMADFSFFPALSNEPVSSDWNGPRGLITEVVDSLLNGDTSEYEAYLCGRPGMIQACKTVLEKKNIPAERTYFDLFNIAKAPK